VGIVMVFGLGWILNRMSQARGDCAPRVPVKDGFVDGAEPGMFVRWLRSLTRMTLQLLPEYLVIVLLLGAARAWLFPALDVGVDNSLLWIVGLAIAGMLFVIPTAGGVPIVQAALALGMAAGPAAALLVTLPPISLPSLAMVYRSFRRTELALLMGGVVALGVGAAGLAIALGF
jgi:uncharacterized membrane protein YraQ (UPF0718 family)